MIFLGTPHSKFISLLTEGTGAAAVGDTSPRLSVIVSGEIGLGGN